MPAAGVVIPAVMSAGASVGQMLSGNKLTRDAKKAIDEYRRQDLLNPYERLQVSTLGADRQREDLARSMATGINQLAMGGSRSIMGGLANMLEQQRQQEAQIAANLDQQSQVINQAKAQGDAMVQNMQEQRELQDLQGLGNMWNTGRQETASGINNLVQTGLSTANAFANLSDGGGGSGGQTSQGGLSMVNTNSLSKAANLDALKVNPTGIFASQPTNIVSDYLRGNLPNAFNLPNVVPTGLGKTGNIAPNLSTFGLNGQLASYYNPLQPFRPVFKF